MTQKPEIRNLLCIGCNAQDKFRVPIHAPSSVLQTAQKSEIYFARFLLKSRQTWQSELSTGVLWPKIPTIEIKRKYLIAFNNAMSNAVVEQVTCAVCACRYSKEECLVINIGCIPNQHVLYTADELPSCVIQYIRKNNPDMSVCLSVCPSVRNAPKTLNSANVLGKAQNPNDFKA